MTLPDTFWAKTAASDCIIWTGAQNSKGYGCFAIDRVSQLAHRVAWEDVNGPIPEGMTIDHLCRVRSCVNTDHMEVVSLGENIRRAHCLVIGERCGNGHLIASSADLYAKPNSGFECRVCRAEAVRRHRDRLAMTS